MNIKTAIVQSVQGVTLSLIFASLAMATVYKTVDKDGNVTFTDSRPGDRPAEKVQLRPITPMSPVQIRRPGSPISIEKEKTATPYSRLEIIEPVHNATVRNQGNFTVKVASNPDIRDEHRVRLLLDGEVTGKPEQNLSFELKNVDRGTHNLTVQIIDQQNRVIQSASTTIHVHRTRYRPDVSINPPG